MGGPSEKAAVRWSCFPGRSALLPMRSALSPRKSGMFSFMLPYSREMIVDISLDCVGSQRPLWGTLVSLPRTLYLMFPYSRRVMIVLRRSLYGVVSDGRVLGPFVPLRPAVLTGFPQGASISLEAGLPNCLSQKCGVLCVSLTLPKHLDSCSTFRQAVVTSRAFPSHFVSWF